MKTISQNIEKYTNTSDIKNTFKRKYTNRKK